MPHAPTFPLNAWYAVAWSHEVGKREILARTLCSRPLALWRKPDNQVVAVDDACWHRLAPLSLGWLENGEVVCKYHGLRFSGDGRCTHMPSQDEVSPGAGVRAYPAVERHRFVWIWLGDPSKADPARVPDMHWNEDQDWAGDGKTLFAKCDYRLFADNLMDLTHETFVHASSIGNTAVAEAPMETSHSGNSVTVQRMMRDIEAPPFWRAQLGKPGNVDRWQIIRFEAPCTIVLDVGVAPTGTGALEGDRSQGVNLRVLNTISPETATTCMYFWSLVRNYRLQDATLTALQREMNAKIFEEDRVVLEAQQQRIDMMPHAPLRTLNIDAGSFRARRIIERMIGEETEPAA
jgi:vanillate O-demethylase monooxygenase subunit